jgi:hypothetical protein
MDEKKNFLPAAVFLRAVNGFFDLIREVDASMSGAQRPQVNWGVKELRKSSPAVWAVDGAVRKKGVSAVYPTMVQAAVVGGVQALIGQPDVPPYFTFDALRELRTVGKQYSRVQELVIYTEDQSSVLNRTLLANVEAILGDSTVSLGSLEGRLEGINVHSAPFFRIYDQRFPKGVSCRFVKQRLAKAISALDAIVLVWGKIYRNRKGVPQQVLVEDFEVVQPEKLPGIKDVSGMIHDLTDGKSLREYMETLRDG